MISRKNKDSIFHPVKFTIKRVLEMLSEKKDIYRIKYLGIDKPVRFSVKQKRIERLANNPMCSCCGKKGIVFRLVTDLHSQVSKTHYTAKLHLYTEDEEDYLNIDHIVPRSYGGKNNDENIQVMCHTCNQRKADSLNSGLDFLIEEREDKI